MAQLRDVKNHFLGDRLDRTSSGPTMVGNTLKGGIAFERTGVQPVHENTRAYSISTSHEKLTGIVVPCKNIKFYGHWTEQLDMCRDMVMVSWYCYQSFVTAIKIVCSHQLC